MNEKCTNLLCDYKKIIRRYFTFIRKVWLVYIIFVPLGLLIGKQRFDSIFEFIWCMLWPKSSINGEWWYVKAYSIMLLLFPLVNALFYEFKKNAIAWRSAAFLGLCTAMIVLVAVTPTVLRTTLKPLIIFLEGYVIAKFQIFDRIDTMVGKRKWVPAAMLVAVVTARLIAADRPDYNTADIFLIAFFVYGFTRIARMLKSLIVLEALGNYSTYMWLIHTFFCYHYFRDLFVASKVSTVMYIQLIAVSLFVAYGLSKIEILLCSFFGKAFKEGTI